MLRLPPTRIIFDARDVEYHALNNQEKIKQLVSQGLEKRIALDHLFPQLSELRASIANQAKDKTCSYPGQPSISEQVLRNTVWADKTRDTWSRSSNNTTDTEPTKAGILSVDGQHEPVMGHTQQTDFDVSKFNIKLEELSQRPRTTNHITPDEIGRLTTRLQSLAPERRGCNSTMTHEHRAASAESDSDQAEPHLPTPFSHRAQMASVGQPLPIRTISGHYSSPSGYVLNASPAEPPYHSSPISSLHVQSSQSFTPTPYPYLATQSVPYTMSRPDPITGVGHVHSVPDLAQQYYYTNPPNGTGTSTQGTSIPISLSNMPRTPRSNDRSNVIEDYTDVFEFGQSTDHRNRSWTSRNAYARRHNGLFVYEDDLPPELQPQTPIGLPRHGIPHSYDAYPLTAPPAGRSRPSVRQPMTPTRSDRRQQPRMPSAIPVTPHLQFISDNDQENAAMYAEMERRRRMRTAGHMAMQQGGELLDTTPPRMSEEGIP